MTFLLITTVAIAQTYIMYLFRKRKTFGLQLVLSIAFLVMHFYVLPKLLLHYSGPTNENCGLPQVAVYFGFWVFGAGVTILSTSLGYFAWSHWKNKKSDG